VGLREVDSSAFFWKQVWRRRLDEPGQLPQLDHAPDLLRVRDAAEKKLLDQKRQEQIELLEERNEVIP